MKTKFLLVALVLSITQAWSQTQIYIMDFESVTNGVDYSTSIAECSDGVDFFGVFTYNLNNTSNTDQTLTNTQGSKYLGVQDFDSAPCTGSTDTITFTITGINISSIGSGLELRAYLGSSNGPGPGSNWDFNSQVRIDYQIDGGGYSPAIWFAGHSNANDIQPLRDTDFNTVGDGTGLTGAMAQFTQSLGVTGNSMDIQITFIRLDATDEDVAIDNIEVYGIPGSTLAASASVTSALACNGDADGQVMASATGGTSPYTYNWNTGETNATETNLGVGTYRVTVTDNNGFTDSASVTLTEPATLVASASVTGILDCNGDIDGQVTGSPSGGTAPYTFSWNTGGTSATETGLGAATYSVTITDQNGCTDSASVTLTEPTALVASAFVTGTLDCNGDTDGQVTGSPSGGTAPYTYNWNTGETAATETSLGAGTYSVTITDNNGCTDSASVTITEPVAISALAVVDSNVTCNGGLDGGGTASASGGSTPYTYLWSNTATTASIAGVGAGKYSVTVTDNNGCTDSASITITEPALLNASITGGGGSGCSSGGSGNLTASATGGTSPYTYLWSNSATTATISGLSTGTYTVTITDANGCTDSESAAVTGADNEDPTAVAKNITVQLDANGEVTITGNDVDNGSTDNCGIEELTVSPSFFDCDDVGFVQGVTVVSDSSWSKSTVVNTGNSLTFPWTGAQTIPADSTFTDSVEVGQPYGWVSIVPIQGTQTIKAGNNVTFYRQTFSISSTADLSVRVRMRVDDDMEVYINGNLLAGEYSFSTQNSGGAAHDLKFEQGGNVINGNNGGDPFDFVTSDTLSNIFQTGNNEVILAIRNTVNNDRGGFTFRMDVGTGDPGVPVVLTVKDSSGNTATANALVVVEDNVAPVLNNMPANKTVSSSDSSTVVYWTPPSPSDACGVQSLTKTNHPGDSFPYGTTAVIYTATDVNGNVAVDSFYVTVVPEGESVIVSNQDQSADYDRNGEKTERQTTSNPGNKSQTAKVPLRLEVYPNPADNKVYISVLNSDEDFELLLFSSTGSLIHHELMGDTSNLTLDVSSLKAGIYFIKLSGKGRMETRKLIVH